MWYWLAKNLLGMSDKLEIFHTSKLPHAEKKPQNNFFVWAPIIVKMKFEKYKYFTNFFMAKIFDALFSGKCSTRPHILFTSCL